MKNNKITGKELDVLGHSIGINVYHARRSNKKSEKKLPKEFYRNYFNATPGHTDMPILKSLMDRQLMEQNEDNTNYYHVTELGISEFKKEFLIQMESPSGPLLF